MTWHFTDDVRTYAAMARPLLSGSAAHHTVSLTVMEDALARDGADDRGELYGWWTDGAGPALGAVSHTPSHELLLGIVPDAAVWPLVAALRQLERPLVGVHGPVGSAAYFAAAWTAATGERAVLAHLERLYRLDGPVIAPSPVAGSARSAVGGDELLLMGWLEAFAREAGVRADAARLIEDRLAWGGLVLWEDGAGEPVALASRGRRAAGVVRVGPVYTPPEHRRHGWASAVTAAVSQASIDAGATDLVLSADLTNATSNGIYQRLGYRRIDDRLVLRFERMEASFDRHR